MVLSSEHRFLRMHVGERRAIEILAGAGFDAIDYGFSPEMEFEKTPWTTDRYADYAKEVKKIAEDNGVYFNQAHGPFKFDISLYPDYSREVLPLYSRCFEICAILGIPHVVVHPIHHIRFCGNEQMMWDMNMDWYRQILACAKGFGVKVAMENMCQFDPKRAAYGRDVFSEPREFARFYDELDDPDVTCCVDIGHCCVAGEDPARVLRVLGSRVGAIHVHDNFLRTDDHIIPGHGLIDWDSVTKALAEIGYQGDFTLEVLNSYRAFDAEFMPVSAKYIHDVGRYMMAKVERYKKELGNAV